MLMAGMASGPTECRTISFTNGLKPEGSSRLKSTRKGTNRCKKWVKYHFKPAKIRRDTLHKSHYLVALAVSPKSLLIDRKDLKYQTNKINYGSRKNHRVSETMKTAQGFIALKAFLITEVDILIKEHRETCCFASPAPPGGSWFKCFDVLC